MRNLLRKEMLLAMHPTVPIMLCLSVMVLIPNYPYTVIFFYTSLAVFFTCLTGRENNDIVYSLMLPVAKKDIVKARMGFTVIQEMIQILLILPFLPLSERLNPNGNLAGTDASLALLGLGFLVYGCFNYVFFVSYYKNVNKVGRSFVIASVAVFVLVALDVVCSYGLPVYAEYIDTPGRDYLSYKIGVLLGGLVLFFILTLLAYRKSVKEFLKRDL